MPARALVICGALAAILLTIPYLQLGGGLALLAVHPLMPEHWAIDAVFTVAAALLIFVLTRARARTASGR